MQSVSGAAEVGGSWKEGKGRKCHFDVLYEERIYFQLKRKKKKKYHIMKIILTYALIFLFWIFMKKSVLS